MLCAQTLPWSSFSGCATLLISYQIAAYLSAEQSLVAVVLLFQAGEEARADAWQVLTGRRCFHQEASKSGGNIVQRGQGCQVQVRGSGPATCTGVCYSKPQPCKAVCGWHWLHIWSVHTR